MSGVTEVRPAPGGEWFGFPDPGATAGELRHLRRALDTRGLVGFATGVVAERYRLSPEQAWAALVELSQHTNTKLRVIAWLIHSGNAGERLGEGDRELAGVLNRRWPLGGGNLIALRPDGADRPE